MSSPIAVLISDIHFSVINLELASESLITAVNKAASLNVPLVVAGDLNDTKAIIRAEVANRLIEIFKNTKVKSYVLIGNHDLINEKGLDHSLNFLRPYTTIVDTSVEFDVLGMIPYQNSKENFLKELRLMPFGKLIICHQGVMGASMGEYVQDKSSVEINEELVNYRFISGHYHKHQTVSGLWTYIGSPYTMSFAEAKDGPKGFLILNEDGTHTREILKLRKHIIYEWNEEDPGEPIRQHDPKDIVWIKIKGSFSKLSQFNKADLAKNFVGHANFKLDLMPIDRDKTVENKRLLSEVELFDAIIDSTKESEETKSRLKNMWKGFI